MKKKIFITIILTFITCMILSLAVSASGYNNFAKERDYYTLIDELIAKNSKSIGTAPYYLYKADENNTWYFDNVKTAYELGILNLDQYDFYNNCTDKVALKDVVRGYSKIISKYLNNSFPSNEIYYAKEIGLITADEYTILKEINPFTPIKADTIGTDSLQFDYYATRKDIQVLTTRLFKIIPPGEYINNFNKLVDVDNIKTPNVSVEGVLQLYNLGILAGNGYGMFTPYQHLTLPEYATIITRVCIPSKRQNIDETTYEKFYSQNIPVYSYKSISDEDATNYIEKNQINKTFAKELKPTEIVTYEDVISSFFGITTAYHKPAKAANVINSFYTFFPLNKFITAEEYAQPATKSKAAIIAMLFANDEKEIAITMTQNLKPEFMSYFYNYELPFINMALSVGLIENTSQDMNNAYLTKAELDKMLTLYGRKFHTNYAYNTAMKGNNIAKLVTDSSKLPVNADMYPYILDFAPKQVYEAVPKELSQSPLYLSTYLSDLYPATISYWNSALDEVLNVDYTYKPAENIRGSNLEYISLLYDQEYIDYYNKSIDDYKQYVIDNEIILKGDATILLPIAYQSKNSSAYKVRVKLEFEVIHSKTNKNLLLYDKDVTYNGNKFEVYVDLPASGDIYRKVAFQFISFTCFMNEIVYGGENIVVNKN